MNPSSGQWTQPELTTTVHRGLARKPTPGRELGMHWSADPAVARRFAGQFGTVVHGEVPISAIETDPHTLKRAAVFLDDVGIKGPPEKEIPVKSGEAVKVTGTTGGGNRWDPKFLDGLEGVDKAIAYNRVKTRQRKRTYKQPREMKA